MKLSESNPYLRTEEERCNSVIRSVIDSSAVEEITVDRASLLDAMHKEGKCLTLTQ